MVVALVLVGAAAVGRRVTVVVVSGSGARLTNVRGVEVLVVVSPNRSASDTCPSVTTLPSPPTLRQTSYKTMANRTAKTAGAKRFSLVSSFNIPRSPPLRASAG